MKTKPTFLITTLFAVMAICATANADSVFIAGFESGDDGFNQVSANGTLALGPTGATEGTTALQLGAPSGAFQFTTSFNNFTFILADPANEFLTFDVSYTPDDATTTFAQASFGTNSNLTVSSGNNFQTSSIVALPLDGSVISASIPFSSLPEFPLIDPATVSGAFGGLLLIGNSDGPGTYTFDNIQIQTAVVPEPSSLVMLGGGLGLLVLRRRKK